MRLADDVVPQAEIVWCEAELLKRLRDFLRVEDAHHQLFAKGRRHSRQTQFDLLTVRYLGAHAAILRTAFVGDIHAAERLDTAGDGANHGSRQLMDEMQYAIDAKADITLLAAWLDMDIAGALLKGVLQQPVDQMHDVSVVGVRFADSAEFGQLLEIIDQAARGEAALAGCAGDRPADAIKLAQKAFDVARVGQHARDLALKYTRDFRFPFVGERFAGGDSHFLLCHQYRQELKARGIGLRDQRGDRFDVDLEWVDTEIIHRAGGRHQPCDVLQGQRFAVCAACAQAEVGELHEGMAVVLEVDRFLDLLGLGGGQNALLLQQTNGQLQGERGARAGRFGTGRHEAS